ncbi:MAG: hypothetical protein E6R03_13625 [Hyphomicrobiaceae bacterium]|nr:MAG: hypothetical protein E6R03_13625 [Hyphomicrobiaceae bacterium]
MSNLVPVKQMSMQEQIDYCKFMSDADLLPAAFRKKPGNIMLAMEMGKIWGLSAIQTITQVHVIDGKPTASANLMSGLVVAAGHKFEVVEKSDQVAHTRITRKDGAVFEARWDMARAKTADLAGRGNWKKYPQAMLIARATSEVCREACADVLCGLIYTPEELGAAVNEDGDVVEGEIVEETKQRKSAKPSPEPAPEPTPTPQQVEKEPEPAPVESQKPEAVELPDYSSDASWKAAMFAARAEFMKIKPAPNLIRTAEIIKQAGLHVYLDSDKLDWKRYSPEQCRTIAEQAKTVGVA